MPLGLEGRVATAQPEEPLGPDDVDHGEHVDQQGRDPEPGHLLEDLVHLERDEDRGADDREVLAPAPHQPQPGALAELERAVARTPRATSSSVECLARRLLDQPDRSGVLQVDPEPVGDRLEQRQVVVEDLLEGVARAVEAEQAIGQGQQQQPAHEALDREQPQDERVAQRPPAQHERRLVGRAGAVRRAEDEVAAAQAAPGDADRGVGGAAARPARPRRAR